MATPLRLTPCTLHTLRLQPCLTLLILHWFAMQNLFRLRRRQRTLQSLLSVTLLLDFQCAAMKKL
jgi:hypothetical protein